LLAALVQVQTDDNDILYVAYDTEARGPLATMAPSAGKLGCALVLSPRPTDNSLFALHWQTLEQNQPQDLTVSGEFAPLVAGNAMAACLPMLESLSGTGGLVTYPIGQQLALELRLALAGINSCQSDA
jgi:hypothetical protein